MRLGPYEALRAMLNQHFGTDYSTDDNDIYDMRTGETVASLYGETPTSLRIQYRDGRPDLIVSYPGCGAEPHELPRGSA